MGGNVSGKPTGGKRRRNPVVTLIAVTLMVALGGSLGGYVFFLSRGVVPDADWLKRIPIVGRLVVPTNSAGNSTGPEGQRSSPEDVQVRIDAERRRLEQLARELDSRKAELDRREIRLSEEEARIFAEREALTGPSGNQAKVAGMYARMRPEDAAKVMRELPDELVIALLVAMDEDKAAKVLASLEPAHAARLTKAMRGEANVPANVSGHDRVAERR